MQRNRTILVVLGASFMVTLATPSYGYIDGGTGSILLQAAVSGVLGALFIARSMFSTLPARLKRKPVRAVESAEETERVRAA